ncbi:ATP-dependent DNA helicase RuvA [Clostridium pasteurianum]|uniref:Holliday junction branch migration protein RuvA n=1 Tax=Clostridium pasteurianum TaxID=1501 RepID=UPI0002A766A1|nr:Holliday junction branch migration protein RuvA [Clostridium pasteurianum]AOZ75554.1 ATP-dependent DNA helicase RuvA [Clostridium pasteurianum DSM 525 = ATCC 6013]AOZ79349.1 ATP-dependent DNA helicase RuvA [Clostridium pasteurianum]ELP60548.1 Holliday junction DNA helicase RuvA [Clostridium pasteurianum DSM 525 = ATCC 6013]OMH22259.1 ATP-dependent DNA helicase RuvA [Clostridium pasteurianum]UZW12520.1 Holliday junction branch migration protein RuvA [Clostridium pasteurianum]
MYTYIKGIFIGIDKDYIIIENNGIGYKIYVSGSTIAAMPKTGEDVLLYLEQIVREDFIGLYGFHTEEERDMFNKLLTINGVGAKACLSLLSISTVNNLKYAVLTGDEKLITRAPGIGKKIAQRIILELKDKFEADEFVAKVTEGSGSEDIFVQERNIAEAMGALISLGYSEKEAEKAIKASDKSESLESIIKECLKFLMN